MEGLRPGWAVTAIMVIIITSTLFRCVSAVNHTVGGPTGWDLTSNLQAWAASSTFYAGDYLVFSYGPTHDVLEVNQLDFALCRTINPIRAYDDGETVVHLREAGTRFFICGRRGHCAIGLRLRVQVLPSLTEAPNTGSESSNGTNPDRGVRSGGGGGGGSGQSPPSPSTRRSPPASPPISNAPPHHDDTDRDRDRNDQSEGPCHRRHSAAEVSGVWPVGWLVLLLAALYGTGNNLLS